MPLLLRRRMVLAAFGLLLLGMADCAALRLPRLPWRREPSKSEAQRPPLPAEQAAATLLLRQQLAEAEAEKLELQAKALKLELELRKLRREGAESLPPADPSGLLPSTAPADAPAEPLMASLQERTESQNAPPEGAEGGADAVEKNAGGWLGLGERSNSAEGEEEGSRRESMNDARAMAIFSELGLLPEEISESERLTPEELEMLNDKIFGADSFYARAPEELPIGTLFAGSMRKSPNATSAIVQRRLAASPLAARVRLFLLPDPVIRPFEPTGTLVDLDGPPEPEPCYLAIPTSIDTIPAMGRGGALPFAAPACLFLSLVFTSAFAASVYLPADVVLDETAESLPPALAEALTQSLPLFAGMVFLQLLHDAGHFVAARRYGLRLSPPLFFPSLDLGNIGSHLPLASFPPNRTALADFALAGPLVGGAASLLSFALGLVLTASASEQALQAFPSLPLSTVHASLLVSLAVELVLPDAPSAAATAFATESEALALHPLAIAGFVGLLSNALALLPCGRLDGGRAAIACFGRRPAGALGGVTAVIAICAALFNNEPSAAAAGILMTWTTYVLFLARQGEVPCVDEVTDVDDTRYNLLLALISLAILFLWPAPDALTGAGQLSDGLSGGVSLSLFDSAF